MLGLAQLGQHLEAVPHRHHHIEHDAVRPLGSGEGQGLAAVLSLQHLPPLELEHGAQQAADALLIIHHQRPQPAA